MPTVLGSVCPSLFESLYFCFDILFITSLGRSNKCKCYFNFIVNFISVCALGISSSSGISVCIHRLGEGQGDRQ